jgi:integrase
MAYYVHGRYVRQSTEETDEQKARRVLRKRIAAVLQGDLIPDERRVTLGDLVQMLRTDYTIHRRRSLATLKYPMRHVLDYFDAGTRAVAITTDRLDEYIAHRLAAGSAPASIRIELALLGKAFTLAVRAKKLQTKPYIPKPAGDPSRVRQGFFTREEVERLCTPCTCSEQSIQARTWTPQDRAKRPDVIPCWHLPAPLADLVQFLFWSAWRVGEVRTLEWRDYFAAEGTIRLRPEHSKNRHGRVLPIVGELAIIIARRAKARRLECPYIFHRDGRRLGDFRKVWTTACTAIGFGSRIVHDLRRSGVRHLIQAGNDPHTVMAFSGHRTDSMLKRYHIIALDDLRRAAERGCTYTSEPVQGDIIALPTGTRREGAE